MYDYDSDKKNPRKKLVEGIILLPKNYNLVKKSFAAVLILLIASSIITLKFTNIIGMLLLIGFGLFIFFIITGVITSILDWTVGLSNDFLDIFG